MRQSSNEDYFKEDSLLVMLKSEAKRKEIINDLKVKHLIKEIVNKALEYKKQLNLDKKRVLGGF